jgi:hypothetical protein
MPDSPETYYDSNQRNVPIRGFCAEAARVRFAELEDLQLRAERVLADAEELLASMGYWIAGEYSLQPSDPSEIHDLRVKLQYGPFSPVKRNRFIDRILNG